MMKKRWAVFGLLGAMMVTSAIITMSFFPKTQSKISHQTQTNAQSTQAKTITELQTRKEEPAVKELYQAYTPENIKALWLSQFDLNGVYTDGAHQRAKQD